MKKKEKTNKIILSITSLFCTLVLVITQPIINISIPVYACSNIKHIENTLKIDSTNWINNISEDDLLCFDIFNQLYPMINKNFKEINCEMTCNNGYKLCNLNCYSYEKCDTIECILYSSKKNGNIKTCIDFKNEKEKHFLLLEKETPLSNKDENCTFVYHAVFKTDNAKETVDI